MVKPFITQHINGFACRTDEQVQDALNHEKGLATVSETRTKQQDNIPGHIWLTDAETGSPVLVSLPGVAQAAEAGAHWIPAGMGGWHVTVTETPDQIASLIQQEWYDRISGEAIVRAEFGSGNYVLRNPTGGTGR